MENLFCRNICYIRRTKKLTQKQMADILGIGTSTLRKMERGDPGVRANARMVCCLCDTFGLSADTVLKIDMEKNEARQVK